MRFVFIVLGFLLPILARLKKDCVDGQCDGFIKSVLWRCLIGPRRGVAMLETSSLKRLKARGGVFVFVFISPRTTASLFIGPVYYHFVNQCFFTKCVCSPNVLFTKMCMFTKCVVQPNDVVQFAFRHILPLREEPSHHQED